MRLTILNQFYVPDLAPTGHFAASLAEHRAAAGDRVTVVTSRGGYVAASASASGTAGDNPRVHRIWTPRLGKASALKRIADYLTFYLGAMLRMVFMKRQDVIVAMTTPPYIALVAALHRLLHRRTRLVLWVMDCYPDVMERFELIREGGAVSRLLRWLARRMIARVDHLICLDGAMLELMRSQYVAEGRELPTTVLPNWERLELFPDGAAETEGTDGAEQAAERKAEWPRAAELGLGGRFVVLYLGNTGYGHRFDTVLEAADRLRGEPVTFLFIGGGRRWGEIEAERRRRGLDNVVMHGYIPKEETPAAMRAADCALITLHDRALGVMSPSKLHANLAMRLPVIYVGPEGSNVDEAIARFDCGVSLREGDVEGLLELVRTLRTDRAAAAGYRSRARRAFETAYCDREALRRFDEVIGGLG